MARTKKTRYYKRARWSSNISEISEDIVNAQPGANCATTTLAFNPIQTNTATSQVYTTKNFEVSFTFELNSDASAIGDKIEDITAYIMYVPQGMNVNASYNIQHPEYIMNYKFIGTPSGDNPEQGQQYQPYKLRTRLSRKLNTGDSVILFVKYNNTYTNAVSGKIMEIHGIVRWWTRAN